MEDENEPWALNFEYERAFLWPDVQRTVFRDDKSCDGAAFGRYREGSGLQLRHHYRRSYEVAVESLYSAAIQSGRRATFVLPLMFLWRHLLEVTLKDLIHAVRDLFVEELSGPEMTAMGRHDLLGLWRLAKSHVRTLGCQDGEINNVEAVLREICEVDPYADGFRYPFRIDGQTKNLEGVPETINLGGMNDALQGVFNFLSVGFDEVQRLDDFFGDYECEMAREYGWPDSAELGRARRAYAERHSR